MVELWRDSSYCPLSAGLTSPRFMLQLLLSNTTSTRSASFTANVLLVLHCELNRAQIIHDFMHLEIHKTYHKRRGKREDHATEAHFYYLFLLAYIYIYLPPPLKKIKKNNNNFLIIQK